MKKILLAEDDPNFGMMLKSYLEVNGYYVTLKEDGNQAYSSFRTHDYDLCILDVMMPYKDGFSLAESIRHSGKGVPFIFLTARAMKEDQVKGYKLGALDYLVKPFDPEILLLKVTALISSKPPDQEPVKSYELGSFLFNADKRTLLLGDENIKLSPKEADLLHLLLQHRGKVLKREEALIKIWKEDSYFTTKSMDVYITKLRKHLRKDPRHTIEITNLHGKGFLLSSKKV